MGACSSTNSSMVVPTVSKKPSWGRKGVYTQHDLDTRCKQEINLALELSQHAGADEMSWAILESEHHALDEKMIAEALARSYECPRLDAKLIDDAVESELRALDELDDEMTSEASIFCELSASDDETMSEASMQSDEFPSPVADEKRTMTVWQGRVRGATQCY
mmetsp:Transcript_42245/g.83588  ORF Transcript_42245/g.83588 Transcript_42245/m.83588 type:complete len:163 (+) Transcript_42245:89-577(+)